VVALNDGALDAATELKISLFADAVATFKKTGSEAAVGGGVVWTGASEAGDTATLVFARGKVTGRVTLKGHDFEIEGAGGARAHRVIEVDADQLPPEGPLTIPQLPPQKKQSAVVPQATGDTKIRTLIPYTDRAAAASSDIVAEANLAISLANQGYRASGVNIKMVLAGTIRVAGYDEALASWGDTLANLANVPGAPNPAPFDGVRQARNSLKADLVMLLRAEPSPAFCGLGYLIESPDASTSGYGFSETDRICITNQSATHEMGHNMGLNHDRYVVSGASQANYNFGYVIVRKQVRDIMAYNNKCVDAGTSCVRLNKFSSPLLTAKKSKFGIAAGKVDPADNARRLNETRQGVASYR